MSLVTLVSIVDWDQQLFHVLNREWTNGLFDTVLPIWRDKYFWLPVYLFIITFSFYNYGKKAYWLMAFMILTVGTADLVSSQLIKKNVKRTRPCNDVELTSVRELVHCGSGYSFTSSHSTNHFALSFFLLGTLAVRRKWLKWLLIGWAASIAYAQVYVGVHFPIDVISGAILGVLIARVLLYAYRASGKSIVS